MVLRIERTKRERMIEEEGEWDQRGEDERECEGKRG